MVDGTEQVSKQHSAAASIASRPGSVHSNITVQQPLTPWQKLQQELNDPEKVLKEVTLGKRIGHYRLKGNLGTGNFSVVKLGMHILTKEKVAVKMLDKGKLDHKTQKLLSREIEAMEEVHHPNILRLYEVIETLSTQYFVMEYAAGGELYAKVSNKEKARLEEEEGKNYFAQIIDAIEHLHSRNICHRDIKAENIFFSGSGSAKVGDFGFSIRCRDETLNTFCGSPPYAAPELFKDDHQIGYIGTYVDIWALGVLLYFMLTGGMPFRAENVSKLKKCILEGTYVIPPYISEDAASLIRAILIEDPERRISIADMKTHPWLAGAKFPVSLPLSSLQPELDNEPSDLDDKEAQKTLDSLGIPRDMLSSVIERGAKNGPRNAITGTYRISLHKATHKRLSPPPQPQPPAPLDKKNKKGKNKKDKSSKKKNFPGRSRSKICSIM